MLQPHTQQYMLHIRSKDCRVLTPPLNTHLEVKVNPAIQRAAGHEFMMSISSAEIPYTWFNVCAHLKSAQIYVDGNPSLQLEDANYNIFELMAAINAKNANGTFPFSADYDLKTNKVTMANMDTSSQHTLNFSQEDSRELSKMLGFDRDTDITVASAGSAIASHTSDGTVNLRPVHSIFLHSSLASTNVHTSTEGIEKVIDKIPIGRFLPRDMIAFDYYQSAPFSSTFTTEAINTFDLSLRDQNGRLLDLNGARFEISLFIEQKLNVSMEVMHPSQRSSRRSLETKETKDKVTPVAPSDIATPSGLANLSSPTPQPLGGSTIPIASNTPSIPSIKRPRVDEEQVKRQELELDQAIMLAADL